jgi:hypothetical protein
VDLLVGECSRASERALSSIEYLSSRPEPYELLGYCQGARGFPRKGVEAMQKALEWDPNHWEPRFGLAVLRAQAGEDPLPDLERARVLNPREDVITQGIERFREAPRETWPDVGIRVQQRAIERGRLRIAEQ